MDLLAVLMPEWRQGQAVGTLCRSESWPAIPQMRYGLRAHNYPNQPNRSDCRSCTSSTCRWQPVLRSRFFTWVRAVCQLHPSMSAKSLTVFPAARSSASLVSVGERLSISPTRRGSSAAMASGIVMTTNTMGIWRKTVNAWCALRGSTVNIRRWGLPAASKAPATLWLAQAAATSCCSRPCASTYLHTSFPCTEPIALGDASRRSAAALVYWMRHCASTSAIP